jgi:anti-anti-sigma factor
MTCGHPALSEDPSAPRRLACQAGGSAPPERGLLQMFPTLRGDHAVLVLRGEIDMSNTQNVREAVTDCLAWQPVILSLDLSALSFCSAGGIHALYWARQQAQAGNVKFRIVAVHSCIRRVFTAARADDLLAVQP